MLKNKKVWVPVIILLIVTGGITIYGALTGKSVTPFSFTLSGAGEFPLAEPDASVYAVVEKYLAMQIEYDQDSLLSLLSDEHRSEWQEESYLVPASAFDLFDEVRLEQLKMGVIDFQDIDGVEHGLLLTTYRVSFINDGNVEAAVDLIEEVGLSHEGETWLIELSRRSIMEESQV